jgi:hypothetical protein
MTHALMVLVAAVWYVQNTAPAGGNGSQTCPQPAAAADAIPPGDTIIVPAGDHFANLNTASRSRTAKSLLAMETDDHQS